MMNIKKVNSEIEKQILTAMIVSTQFCNSVMKMYDRQYFKTDFIQKISGWVKKYYQAYLKSPDLHIKDIFNVEKEKLKDSEISLIETFLTNLSEEYEQKERLNIPYLIDQATDYFRTRSMEILYEKGNQFVNAGRIDDAQKLLEKQKSILSVTSGRFRSLQSESIKKWANKDEEYLFKFAGDLGEMIGPMKRGWLVGFLGPMKRGKSFSLDEVNFQALDAGLKVFEANLEMSEEDKQERIYQRITGQPLENEKDIIYPVFDCKLNQENNCRSKFKTNDIEFPGVYKNKKVIKPTLDELKKTKYKICAYCRDKNPKKFIPEIWFEIIDKRNKVTGKQIEKKAKDMNFIGSVNQKRNNLVTKCYPAYSANIKDIINELDDLEYSENFIPDIITIDYEGILAPEDTRLTGRDSIDLTMKSLKSLAQKRHCIVFTASQSNRASIKKRSVSQIDTAEDIRKIAHINVGIGLNQIEIEHDAGILRMSVIAHRHKKFSQKNQVRILQCLSLGQFLLDSCWYLEDD